MEEKPGGPRKEEVPVDYSGLFWPMPGASWKTKAHLSGFQEHSTKGGRKSHMEYSLWYFVILVIQTSVSPQHRKQSGLRPDISGGFNA